MGKLSGRGMGSRISAPASRLGRIPEQKVEGSQRRSKDWLNTSRWQRLRLQVLARDRYICQQTGIALLGKHPAPDSPVVDHRVPHRGDEAMFWDEDNLQAVSKAWHDGEKQSREKRGLA